MTYTYTPRGVCSRKMILDIEDGVLKSLKVEGGCNGNLKAIPILVEGMTVEAIEAKLSGVECGRRGTSCGDQLAKAVRTAYEAMLRGEVQDIDED